MLQLVVFKVRFWTSSFSTTWELITKATSVPCRPHGVMDQVWGRHGRKGGGMMQFENYIKKLEFQMGVVSGGDPFRK